MMQRIRAVVVAAIILSLMTALSACGFKLETINPPDKAPEIHVPAEYTPTIPPTEEPGDELSGYDFVRIIDLSKYDNPYFDTELSSGAVKIKINYISLWDDFKTENTKDKEEREEAEKRAELTEKISKERVYKPSSDIKEIFELPPNSAHENADATAIIKTADDKWYIVDLIGKDAKPEATLLPALEDKTDFALRWATTSVSTKEEKSKGEDIVFAEMSDGTRVKVYPAT